MKISNYIMLIFFFIQGMIVAHTSEQVLIDKCIRSSADIEVGAVYYHYRNPQVLYKILYIGLLEATEEPCVIYQNMDNLKLIWVRAISSWQEPVMIDGRLNARFICVNKN